MFLGRKCNAAIPWVRGGDGDDEMKLHFWCWVQITVDESLPQYCLFICNFLCVGKKLPVSLSRSPSWWFRLIRYFYFPWYINGVAIPNIFAIFSLLHLCSKEQNREYSLCAVRKQGYHGGLHWLDHGGWGEKRISLCPSTVHTLPIVLNTENRKTYQLYLLWYLIMLWYSVLLWFVPAAFQTQVTHCMIKLSSRNKFTSAGKREKHICSVGCCPALSVKIQPRPHLMTSSLSVHSWSSEMRRPCVDTL